MTTIGLFVFFPPPLILALFVAVDESNNNNHVNWRMLNGRMSQQILKNTFRVRLSVCARSVRRGGVKISQNKIDGLFLAERERERMGGGAKINSN